MTRLLLTALLILAGTGSAWPVNQVETYDYCNGRFAFSINIPKNIFLAQPESNNGDGRGFVSKDGSAKLSVYGWNNALSEKLIDIYMKETESGDQQDQRKITYKVIKENWFVVSGYEKDKIFYRKTFLVDDQFKTLIFTYSTSKKEIYEPLIAGFVNTFKETQSQPNLSTLRHLRPAMMAAVAIKRQLMMNFTSVLLMNYVRTLSGRVCGRRHSQKLTATKQKHRRPTYDTGWLSYGNWLPPRIFQLPVRIPLQS